MNFWAEDHKGLFSGIRVLSVFYLIIALFLRFSHGESTLRHTTLILLFAVVCATIVFYCVNFYFLIKKQHYRGNIKSFLFGIAPIVIVWLVLLILLWVG